MAVPSDSPSSAIRRAYYLNRARIQLAHEVSRGFQAQPSLVTKSGRAIRDTGWVLGTQGMWARWLFAAINQQR